MGAPNVDLGGTSTTTTTVWRSPYRNRSEEMRSPRQVCCTTTRGIGVMCETTMGFANGRERESGLTTPWINSQSN